jgi:hypothetical protein
VPAQCQPSNRLQGTIANGVDRKVVYSREMAVPLLSVIWAEDVRPVARVVVADLANTFIFVLAASAIYEGIKLPVLVGMPADSIAILHKLDEYAVFTVILLLLIALVRNMFVALFLSSRNK